MKRFAVLRDGVEFCEINGRFVFDNRGAARQARQMFAENFPDQKYELVELIQRLP